MVLSVLRRTSPWLGIVVALALCIGLAPTVAEAQCSVKILSVDAPDPTASMLSIDITVSVVGCGSDSLVYDVVCPIGKRAHDPVALAEVINGYHRDEEYTITIHTGIEAACRCDEKIHVKVSCIGEPGCFDEGDFMIPCQQGNCPDVGVSATPGDCVAGQTTVGFQAWADAGGTQGRWHFDDGTPPGNWFGIPVSPAALEMHTYIQQGAYNPHLEVQDCPEEPLQLGLNDCANCADIEWDVVASKCDDQRQRTFSVSATVSADGEFIRAGLYDDPDGDGIWNELTVVEGNDQIQLAASVTYPTRNDAYPIRLKVILPCPLSVTENVTVQCKGGTTEHPPDTTEHPPDTTQHPPRDDGGTPCDCGTFDWSCWLCCILFGVFIAALFATLVTLARFLCGVGEWYSLAISLAILIASAVLLMLLCDIDLCTFVISIAAVNSGAWILICGTNLFIPPGCNLWLCAPITVPFSNIWVRGYVLAIIVLWLLWWIIC